MRYIILNYAYGFGPPLRTTELALSVGNELKKKTGEDFRIIIPLIYGEDQKRVMKEAFAEIIKQKPDILLLDKTLGNHLKSVFYGEKSYEESLKFLFENKTKVETAIKNYLSNGLIAETFDGKKVSINRKDIEFEINRNPRVNFNIYPSYSVSFAYNSDILRQTLKENIGNVNKKIIEKVIPLFEEIENDQQIYFIADPATFSYKDKKLKKKKKNEVYTPPTLHRLKNTDNNIQKGIYVTVTGIPGLNRLFEEARKIGLKIYSNKPDAVAGSIKAPPSIISHKNILLHFARSGWGSIWLSQLTNTPFVTPPYDKNDDPEIYFNNICIEKLGLGIIYKNQNLNELLKFKEVYKSNIEKMNKYLIDTYGTIDGIKYTTKKIVDHFINI